MAIAGGAVLTPMMGVLADRTSVALAYGIPLAGYVLIGCYSWFGQTKLGGASQPQA
jgi:FHS family L-fucose permease-like MFS transporter